MECGQALPVACPRCGFAPEAGARFCGALAARADRRDEARDHLETAVRMIRAMEMRYWLPGAEGALAAL